MTAQKIELRVLVYKDGKQWVARCLEHDLVARASSKEQVAARFVNTLGAAVTASRRLRLEPFEGIPCSPRRYFDLWDELVGHEPKELEGTSAVDSLWDALLRSCGLDGMLETSLAFAH
jgi:hypothetical protein